MQDKHFDIPRLTSITHVERIGDYLVDSTDLHVEWSGTTVAQLRLAVAGDELAVFATIGECEIIRRDVHYEGSCLDLYFLPVGETENYQVTFLPLDGAHRSEVLAFRHSEYAPAPMVRHSISRLDQGYQVLALIPMDQIGLDSDSERFYFEIGLSIVPAPGEPRTYLTLFGSVDPDVHVSKYGEARVSCCEV